MGYPKDTFCKTRVTTASLRNGVLHRIHIRWDHTFHIVALHFLPVTLRAGHLVLPHDVVFWTYNLKYLFLLKVNKSYIPVESISVRFEYSIRLPVRENGKLFLSMNITICSYNFRTHSFNNFSSLRIVNMFFTFSMEIEIKFIFLRCFSRKLRRLIAVIPPCAYLSDYLNGAF